MKGINDNIVDAAFDICGRIVATAIRGKGNEADDLTGFQPDLTQPVIDAFLTDPVAHPVSGSLSALSQSQWLSCAHK